MINGFELYNNINLQKLYKGEYNMGNNILVLVGSPRIKGNTDILADEFIEGAIEGGNTVTKIHLGQNKINGCLGCDKCNKDGQCIQKDDMNKVYDAYKKANIIVFASPLYYWNFTSQMKAVIDRFYAMGSSLEGKKIKKSCVLLVTAADNDEDTFKQITSYYEANMIKFMKWEDKGRLLVGGVSDKGDIKSAKGLKEARIIGLQI